MKNLLSLALLLLLHLTGYPQLSPMVFSDTTIKPKIAKQPGNPQVLRAVGGKLYGIDQAGKVTEFNAVTGATPVATSASQLTTLNYSRLRLNGSDWVQRIGTVATSTPGYGAIVLPGPIGLYYQREYDGPNFYSEWFDIIGDNSTDDRAAIQRLFDACHFYHTIAVFQGGKGYRITGSVNLRKGMAGVYMPNTSSLRPVGNSGYWAVTTDYEFQYSDNMLALKVVGTGNTVNGIQIRNMQRTTTGRLEVENLFGAGVHFIDCWDDNVPHVSVNGCGSPTMYAYGWFGDSNMSTVSRTQVENCRGLIMSTEGSTLHLVHTNIHSEGATATTLTPMAYRFDGQGNTFINTRIHSAGTNPEFVGVRLAGAGTRFADTRIEGTNQPVDINAWDTNNWQRLILENLNVLAGKVTKSGNGYADVTYGIINRYEGFTTNTTLNNLRIGTLAVGSSPTTPLMVNRCDVATLSSVDVTSRAEFTGCNIFSGTVLQNTTIFRRSTFSPTLTNGGYTIGFCKVELRDGSTINGNITVNTAHLLAADHSKINGGLTIPDNNGRQNQFDPSFSVTGPVVGFAPNNANQYALMTQGARCYNPKPGPGQVEYYYLSSSGWVGVNSPALP